MFGRHFYGVSIRSNGPSSNRVFSNGSTTLLVVYFFIFCANAAIIVVAGADAMCSTPSSYCIAPPGQTTFTILSSDLQNGCLANLLPCPVLNWDVIAIDPAVTDADLALFPSSIIEITGTLTLDNADNAQTSLTSLAGLSHVKTMGGLFLVCFFASPCLRHV